MSAYKNGAGAEAVRTMEWRPYVDPEDVGVGEVWIGKPGQRSIIWTADDEFTMRVHDGFTPGGHIIEGDGAADDRQVVEGENPIRVTESPTDTFTVELILAPDAGNQLELRASGLYVPEPEAGPTGSTETVEAGDTSVRVVEAPTGTFAVAVEVSADAGNALTLVGDGLYVSEAEAAGITVLDGTNPILVTENSTDDFTVSLRVSLAEGNQLSVDAGGLFVPAPPTPPDPIVPEVYTAGPGILFTDTGDTEISVRVAAEDHDYLRMVGEELLVPPVDVVTSATASTNLVAGQAGELITLTDDAPVFVIQTEAAHSYVDGQETAVCAFSQWTITVPLGVALNGVAGPATFAVGALPDGVMFKRLGPDSWLGLGDARELS